MRKRLVVCLSPLDSQKSTRQAWVDHDTLDGTGFGSLPQSTPTHSQNRQEESSNQPRVAAAFLHLLPAELESGSLFEPSLLSDRTTTGQQKLFTQVGCCRVRCPPRKSFRDFCHKTRSLEKYLLGMSTYPMGSVSMCCVLSNHGVENTAKENRPHRICC